MYMRVLAHISLYLRKPNEVNKEKGSGKKETLKKRLEYENQQNSMCSVCAALGIQRKRSFILEYFYEEFLLHLENLITRKQIKKS